jgi:uncharacterized protein YaiI (UPF0178 family)
MHIWVDADACPVAVKEILLRAAERLRVELILVRGFMQDRHERGVQTGGPMPFSHAGRQTSANQLERFFARHD